jgi:Na+/H+-dicarboxylate symporter
MARFIKNVVPAMVTAFGSASSAAALPLSIQAAEKNLKKKPNAGVIVPSIVNIHLVGDCFFIPLIAITVMTSLGMEFPPLRSYLIFAAHFMLAKFAVAAVPGGGVLVMIPVLQTYLGLSSDMLALVTAIYILFDPLITTCNVAGNACFAIGCEKLMMTVGERPIRSC